MYHSAITPNPAPVIFVGVDFSPGSDRALRRSLLIRRDTSFKLVLGHVVPQARGADRLQKLAEAEQLLDQMQSSVRALEHVHCTTIVRHGSPVDQLALAARECGADLAVFGPPRSRRPTMGPTLAERTAIKGRLPVLVAKGVPASLYRRALVATKLDREDEALFEPFSTLFGRHDLSLDLVHLCDAFLPEMMRSAAVDPRRIREVEAAEQWRAILSLLDRLRRTGLRPAHLLTPPSKGPVPRQIIEMAIERGCDLIAASAARSSILKDVLLGNTVTSLVRASDMDVLVVPK